MCGVNREIVLKLLRAAVLFTPACAVAAGGVRAGAATPPQLRYVVIITRHGVRSPTWTSERLSQYSAQPWPDWGVPPGNLTPHGRALMKLMGAYYREWLSGERLLSAQGCEDAGRVYIHADTDQRTIETGRALAETLLPGCVAAIHSAPEGSRDPLFDPSSAGIAKHDSEIAAEAVRKRLRENPRQFMDSYPGAIGAIQTALAGSGSAPKKLIGPPEEISVAVTGKSIQVNDQLNVASSLSEDLLLEYTEGMQGKDLGWGRLDSDTLFHILKLHAVYADLMRRTPYLARASGSNFLDHVLLSMEQAAGGKAVPGALGGPGTAVLIISGHDTNLSNLSGMLGLSWHLPGYQPDDTPPGGALIFSLWKQPDTTEYFVRTQYLAQTLQQMRIGIPVTMAAPPANEDVVVSGCESAKKSIGCPWETFAKSLGKAIDNHFVVIQPAISKRRPPLRMGP
jgi:4-phytase/acid phosphatase